MNSAKEGSKQAANGIPEGGIPPNQAPRRKYGAHAGLKLNFNNKKKRSSSIHKTTMKTTDVVLPDTGKTIRSNAPEKIAENWPSAVAACLIDIGQVQTSLESLEVSENSKNAPTDIQPPKVSNLSSISAERKCDDLDHVVDQSLNILRTPKLVKARPNPETQKNHQPPSSCATGQPPAASKDIKAQKLFNAASTQRPSKIRAPQHSSAEAKLQSLSKIAKRQPRLKDMKSHESTKDEKLHPSLKDVKSLETTNDVKLPCSEDIESHGSRKDDKLHSRLKDAHSHEPVKDEKFHPCFKDIKSYESTKDDKIHTRLKDTESHEPKKDGKPQPRFKAIHSHEPTKDGKLHSRFNESKSHEHTKDYKIPHTSMEIKSSQLQKDFKTSLMSAVDVKLLRPKLSDSKTDSKEQQCPKKPGMHTGMKLKFRSKQQTVLQPFHFQNKHTELQESCSRRKESAPAATNGKEK